MYQVTRRAQQAEVAEQPFYTHVGFALALSLLAVLAGAYVAQRGTVVAVYKQAPAFAASMQAAGLSFAAHGSPRSVATALFTLGDGVASLTGNILVPLRNDGIVGVAINSYDGARESARPLALQLDALQGELEKGSELAFDAATHGSPLLAGVGVLSPAALLSSVQYIFSK